MLLDNNELAIATSSIWMRGSVQIGTTFLNALREVHSIGMSNLEAENIIK
jgi:hypothetical protein